MTSFASALYETGLVALDRSGDIVERFDCPLVDRVIGVGETLIGLEWGRAWGLHWGGGARVGDLAHVSGYNVRTGQRLWRWSAGVSGLVGDGLGVCRDGAWGSPNHVFDVRTGEKRWAFAATDPVVASDATTLYALGGDGVITAYDLITGAMTWRFERVRGAPCRALATTRLGVWYVCHPEDERAVLTCISAGGEVVSESEFRGRAHDLFAIGDALVLEHEFGLAFSAGTTNAHIVTLTDGYAGARARGDRAGVAMVSPGGALAMLAGPLSTDRVHEVALVQPWSTLHVDRGVATLSEGTRMLRWPLTLGCGDATIVANVVRTEHGGEPLEPATVVFAGPRLVLVEHASRGRFTLDVADTGLAKGAVVEIGGFVPGPMNSTMATELAYTSDGQTRRVEVAGADESTSALEVARPVERRTGDPPAHRLIDVATAHRLMAPLPPEKVRNTALRVFADGELDDSALAYLLRHVHGEGDAGLAFGFIAHRWEFGYETADVIAEFAECLHGEPVRLEQITENPLHVRAWRGGASDDVWIELDSNGLRSIARFIDGQLAAAHATRRVFALETNGDWHAFLIRPVEEIEALRRAGIRGISGF